MDVGRPAWWEEYPHKVTKLEEGFIKGLNDREACLYAEITERQLYYYQETHPNFVGKKELLKENIKAKAKFNIAKAIESEDRETSKWYLERRDKDFKPKSDITTDDKPIPILSVQNNDSHKENTGDVQEDKGSSGGDSGEQDNINNPILN